MNETLRRSTFQNAFDAKSDVEQVSNVRFEDFVQRRADENDRRVLNFGREENGIGNETFSTGRRR